MKQAYVEAVHDFQERDVDALESFGLRLQCRYKLGLGIKELSGKKGATHGLEHDAPFSGLRAKMWGGEEDDAISG